ncbi:hypothetical protein JTE90_000539 [Oedothorax gibbosus]|uniref:Uncharacterized protein n=1 Tax=Oedothorax gibbosus TaxID=931172 RepID=A0AAV6VW68_9ARAC|nr:hypothetical protein JTE90_000539 [Oedothorax gibbosus]
MSEESHSSDDHDQHTCLQKYPYIHEVKQCPRFVSLNRKTTPDLVPIEKHWNVPGSIRISLPGDHDQHTCLQKYPYIHEVRQAQAMSLNRKTTLDLVPVAKALERARKCQVTDISMSRGRGYGGMMDGICDREHVLLGDNPTQWWRLIK